MDLRVEAQLAISILSLLAPSVVPAVFRPTPFPQEGMVCPRILFVAEARFALFCEKSWLALTLRSMAT